MHKEREEAKKTETAINNNIASIVQSMLIVINDPVAPASKKIQAIEALNFHNPEQGQQYTHMLQELNKVSKQDKLVQVTDAPSTTSIAKTQAIAQPTQYSSDIKSVARLYNVSEKHANDVVNQAAAMSGGNKQNMLDAFKAAQGE